MKLNNISDEELDRLFKDSAESFDPPFDPEAWEAMEQRLQQAEPRPSWFTRFYPAVVLLTFLSLIVVHRFAPESVKTPQKQPTATSSAQSAAVPQAQPEKSVARKISTAPHRSGEESIERNSPELGQTKAAERPIRVEAVVASPRANSFRKPAASTSGTVAAGTRPGLRGGTQTKKYLAVSARGQADGTSTQRDPVPAALLVHEEPLMQTRGHLFLDELQARRPEQLTLAPLAESVLLAPQDTTAKESSQDKAEEGPGFLRSVQIAVAVAPDLTTVKFRQPEGLSANAGVLVGLPLTRRLSLVTGAVWANKKYSASPQEYSFAGGYTSYSPIDATCAVLDLPLNLRYTVLESGKNAVAVQAGLSSYLMLREEYTSGGGYGAYGYRYQVKNQNQHWFKVQNVSLVYTRALSPLFSVGVEPFVKVPLSGIGAGKVRLTSAGVFFSAGYTLRLKP